ncbi:hypothetical protein LG329_01780 [Virgibacillus necropolis]|uniref:hypothetical protein n=1 Tax=Virgibacillus necropolis TaxID=163877 RepID=UPI003850FDA3
MSDKDTVREDQANELRKLFNEVQGNETSILPVENTDEKIEDDDYVSENASISGTRNIDILNLPPRREVHGNKKKRTQIKVSRPFVRLSVVIIAIIAIILAIYYVWGEELIQLPIKFQ